MTSPFGSERTTYGLIWVLLWVVGVGAMTAWLAAHAQYALLAGLIGFDEYWRLPAGALVLGLALAALYTFRDPSPWRLLAIAAFLGTAAAFVLSIGRTASPIAVVFQLMVILLALVGSVATVASALDERS